MMEIKLTVVMIGPHGSGKTTLGQALARLLQFEYHEEIGKVLRKKALKENPNQTAEKSQPNFDLKVFELEMSRDNLPFNRRIVETWHPGNLSYAGSRSPEIAKQYIGTLKEHVQGLGQIVLVQPLEIDKATSRKRLTEHGPEPGQMVDYFRKIYMTTLSIAQTWGMTILPPVRTDRLNQHDSIQAIRNNLQGHGVIGSSFQEDPGYTLHPQEPLTYRPTLLRDTGMPVREYRSHGDSKSSSVDKIPF